MASAVKKKQTAGHAARRSGDDVTAYALDVVAGDIVAGPHVRAACRRHLRDLETGAERGLYFDPEAAADFFDFCEALCTVLVDGASSPLILSPAQRFISGSIFGWKRADGWRRFRQAFIEMGKGNGKSPLAAAVGLYGLIADGEEQAQIYAAATRKDQAMILFQDAVRMRAGNADLSAALTPSGGNPVWQLTHLRSASFFRPIADGGGSKGGQSGPRPHFGLVDEVHEVKDAYTLRMLKAGFKARKQPLLFMITNSGSDRQSVAYSYHELGIEVVNGDKEDDAAFYYICALDDGDNPFEDESCWIKANPELGNIIDRDYIRKEVGDAMLLPSSQNGVLRLNFCVWTDADRAWITRQAWDSCEVSATNPTPSGGLGKRRSVTVLRVEDFAGDKAFGGLDLSWSQDLTARALTFKDSIAGVDHLYSFLKFWTPADTLRQRAKQDQMPYELWVEQGFLTATPGKVVPMQAIGRQLHEDQQAFDLQFVAYDRYRHKDLEDKLAEEGYTPPMLEHPQGFRRFSKVDERLAHQYGWFDERGQIIENPLWMPGSIEAWEHAIIEGRFHTPFNPVLRWNVAGVFPQPNPSGTGDIIFNKRKATGRIDGAVACAMSVGAAVARFGPEGSALDDFLSNPVMTI